jgi:acyl carrier protein
VSAQREAIVGELRTMLCELLLLQPDDIKTDSLLIQNLSLDSLGFAELEFAIEEKFDVSFPDVKATPELFTLPLPDGLLRIEEAPGGTTLFEYIKAEVVRARLERGMNAAEAVFERETAGGLAQTAGGPVPMGIAPETPVTELHLADLFRFTTVDVMARYVEFLISQRSSAAAS